MDITIFQKLHKIYDAIPFEKRKEMVEVIKDIEKEIERLETNWALAEKKLKEKK